MVIIDRAALNALIEAARANPRRRLHRNLHASYDEPSQRLLIAMEPDSYIQPHRHLADPKPEAFIALAGSVALVTFDDAGDLRSVTRLGPGHDAVAVDLPVGVWHAVVSLASGSVFYETKPGPYNPLQGKDMAPWAPAEGTAAVAAYQAGLRGAVHHWGLRRQGR